MIFSQPFSGLYLSGLTTFFAVTCTSKSELLRVVGPISMLHTGIPFAVPLDCSSLCPAQSYPNCFLFSRNLLKSLFCFCLLSTSHPLGLISLKKKKKKVYQMITQLTLFFCLIVYSSVSFKTYLDLCNHHRIQSSSINPQNSLRLSLYTHSLSYP